MPKAVVSMEGNLRSFASTDPSLAESREALDPATMAEMLYQGFEQNVEELSQRGVNLPPPTDMNGRPVPGYEPEFRGAGYSRPNGARPASSSEQAIVALVDVREDMLRRYSAVSQDPTMASTIAMSIQKLESQIIAMGGEVERFDPAKYRSGLRPVGQSVDQLAVAKKVVDNTKQVYAEYPIKEIYAGTNKSGKAGICIKLACSSGGKPVTIHGTVVPKFSFSGSEAIDFVVDPATNHGRMSVKSPNQGAWEDVSANYDVAWQATQEG